MCIKLPVCLDFHLNLIKAFDKNLPCLRLNLRDLMVDDQALNRDEMYIFRALRREEKYSIKIICKFLFAY